MRSRHLNRSQLDQVARDRVETRVAQHPCTLDQIGCLAHGGAPEGSGVVLQQLLRAADDVTGDRPRLVPSRNTFEGAPQFTLVRTGEPREGDGALFPGRDRRHVQLPGGDLPAVELIPPAEPKVCRVPGVSSVVHLQPPVLQAELDGSHHGRVLGQHGCGSEVREHHSIADERSVVEFLAEVASVAVELLTILGGGPQSVIAPLPHETAVPLRERVEQLLIIGDSARAVAHGVEVLTQNHGTLRQLCRAAWSSSIISAQASGHRPQLFER